MLAELRNVSMKKRDIFSYFRVGGTTEAINSTVNEFIDCYQLITCSGHPNASKKSSGVLLCGGCMVAHLSSRPNCYSPARFTHTFLTFMMLQLSRVLNQNGY